MLRSGLSLPHWSSRGCSCPWLVAVRTRDRETGRSRPAPLHMFPKQRALGQHPSAARMGEGPHCQRRVLQ